MQAIKRLIPSLACLCLLWPASSAWAAGPSEAQVKAAYLINFAKLTDWPAATFDAGQGEFQACLLTQRGEGIGPALARLAGKNIQGRALQVKQGARLNELRACQLLVLESGEERQLPAVLEALGNSPTLTVGDFEDFGRKGGMIELGIQDKRIVFDVNLDASTRSGLNFSAQLLKLARVIRKSP